MKLSEIIILFVFSGCNTYNWEYQVCNQADGTCLEPSARFKDFEACQDYKERHSLGCLGGQYLQRANIDDPVCWKREAILGEGRCNKL